VDSRSRISKPIYIRLGKKSFIPLNVYACLWSKKQRKRTMVKKREE